MSIASQFLWHVLYIYYIMFPHWNGLVLTLLIINIIINSNAVEITMSAFVSSVRCTQIDLSSKSVASKDFWDIEIVYIYIFGFML